MKCVCGSNLKYVEHGPGFGYMQCYTCLRMGSVSSDRVEAMRKFNHRYQKKRDQTPIFSNKR